MSDYIYPQYVVCIMIISELIKKSLSEAFIHAKWITFGVAFVFGVVGVIIQLDLLHQEVDFFRMVTSFGVACLGYDYVIKPIKDKYFPTEKNKQ